MRCHKSPQRGLSLMLIIVITLPLVGCATQQSRQVCEAPAPRSASIDPDNLWDDATKSTIGATKEWTNKVELADIDGDGL